LNSVRRPASSSARQAWGKGLRLSRLSPYLLVLPALAFIFVFLFWPVLYSLFISAFDWQLGAGSRYYVGFENYIRLFSASDFRRSVANTAVYSGSVSIASIALGLLLALAVRNLERFKAFYQSAFFLPVAATMAAMAVVWAFMFEPSIGIVTQLAGAVGIAQRNWLNDDLTAMIAVILVGIWHSTGYAMVLFLAGLTSIPRELHEAAAIDGAPALEQFRWITWPLLSPTTLFVVVIMTVNALKAFDSVKVLTDGGPLGATQVLSHLLYEEGFRYFDTGYASAIAVVFFVILLVLALVQVRIMERQVHYVGGKT
jgi:multiple sugar transport system permease protein